MNFDDEFVSSYMHYAAALRTEVLVVDLTADLVRIVIWDVDHTDGTPSTELYVRAIMELSHTAMNELDEREWDIDFEVCEPEWYKLEAWATRKEPSNLVDVPMTILRTLGGPA